MSNLNNIQIATPYFKRKKEKLSSNERGGGDALFSIPDRIALWGGTGSSSVGPAKIRKMYRTR